MEIFSHFTINLISDNLTHTSNGPKPDRRSDKQLLNSVFRATSLRLATAMMGRVIYNVKRWTTFSMDVQKTCGTGVLSRLKAASQAVLPLRVCPIERYFRVRAIDSI